MVNTMINSTLYSLLTVAYVKHHFEEVSTTTCSAEIITILIYGTVGMFWGCNAPSVSLLTALAVTLVWSSECYLLHLVELPLFILNLVAVGGLFVLTAFVILTHPNDCDNVFSSTSIISSAMIGFFGVMVDVDPTSFSMCSSSSGSEYVLVYLFILVELMGSLLILYSFMYEGEESFSSIWAGSF